MRIQMTKNKSIWATSLIVSAFSCAHGDLSAQAIQPETESVQDTIVVVSKRRAQTDITSPDAITTISGEDLDDAQVDSLADLDRLIPNFYYSQNFGISQIFIRGIGNNFSSPGGDPGVAQYLDGVYLSDQEATAVALFDLSQIEVLRGPQGALYGRNATGGAVNLVSNLPDSQIGIEGEAAIGDFGFLELSSAITGPVLPDVASRLAIRYRQRDGFAKNEFESNHTALDDEESFIAKGQVLIPVIGGELRLIGNYYHQDDTGPGQKILPDEFSHPAELLFGVRPSSSERDFVSQASDNEREVWSSTANWSGQTVLGDTTITADYRESARLLVYDQDGTSASQSTVTFDTHSSQFFLEGYAKSRLSDEIDLLIGASYTGFEQTRSTQVPSQVPGLFLDPTLPVTTPVFLPFENGGTLDSKSWSVFSEVAVEPTESTKISLGLRYNNDEKKADEFQDVFSRIENRQSDSWSDVSGRASFEYHPTDSILLYAAVARGFKSGALNVGALTPPVQPETVDNVEMGAKVSDLVPGLDVSATAFTSNYKDLQIVQIGSLSAILSNAPDSSISGIEFESDFDLNENWSLSVNAAWLDAEFGSFVTSDPRRGFLEQDIRGNRLPYTSEWQSGALLRYAGSINSNIDFEFAATANYRSSLFFTEFNTPDARQKGFAKYGLSAGVVVPEAGWRASLEASNVSDETTTSGMVIVSPLLGSVRVASIAPPRQFKLRLSKSF